MIPCISFDLHNKICKAAAEMGINYTRQLEVFGLNASQMALNLLGGSNRSVIFCFQKIISLKKYKFVLYSQKNIKRNAVDVDDRMVLSMFPA